MDLKPIFTIKPSEFDHEKVRKAVLSKINVVSLDMPGISYGLHARLIDSVKKIQDKHGFPIGIIHSIHPQADDLDIKMAAMSGVQALSVSSLHPVHLKKIKYFAKKHGLPVLVHVDSEPKNEDELSKLVDGFILKSKYLRLFELKSDKKKSALARHLLEFAGFTDASVLAVGDWDLARLLSSPHPKIIVAFVSTDKKLVSKACLLAGIKPMVLRGPVINTVSNAGFINKGERLVNAVDLRQGVTIELAL